MALALVLAVQVAFAQASVESARKSINKAVEATQNPKKNVKVGTWLNLAKAYMEAYDAPAGSAWLGATKTELQLIMSDQKPVSVLNVTLGNETYSKEVYDNKEFYYNANGQLVMINVTSPVVPDALGSARDAYAKDYEVDAKQSKVKDIKAGLELISQKYLQEGMNQYTLGDYSAASLLFEKSADAAATEPLAKVDTTALYNAGFTAVMVKDYQRAKKLFEKCLEVGYYYEGGEVFA